MKDVLFPIKSSRAISGKNLTTDRSLCQAESSYNLAVSNWLPLFNMISLLLIARGYFLFKIESYTAETCSSLKGFTHQTLYPMKNIFDKV